MNRRGFLAGLIAVPLAPLLLEPKTVSVFDADTMKELTRISIAYINNMIPPFQWYRRVFPVIPVKNQSFKKWRSKSEWDNASTTD